MSLIKFHHPEGLEGVFPSPVPALKKAPDYFKAIKPQMSADPSSGTVKRCVPFLDALSAGFIIPLWADVFVTASQGTINIKFPESFPLPQSLGHHSSDQMPRHPLSSKPYGNLLLKWINPWIVQTEPGVSCMFTAPLNHMETRFKVLDGVVDTDTYYNPVNFPFVWTGGDGEFVIPRGTPLVQVIPFRREEFTLEVGPVRPADQINVVAKLGTHLKDGYREEFWSGSKKTWAEARSEA